MAKELIGGFIEDGILKAATSDWAFPIVIVPKPGTGKPGEKKEWRLCIDLRKLNLLIPHDTFERRRHVTRALSGSRNGPAGRWLT